MNTGTEWNIEFDILYNNVSSNKAPGLSIFEKCVFLTQAQEQILKAYFNSKSNKLQEGFDNSTERHIDFANITKVDTIMPLTDANSNALLPNISASSNWYRSFRLPTNMLAIVNEVVIADLATGQENVELQVLPLPYEDYVLTQSKPYKYPLRYQAWRVINRKEPALPIAEIIAHFGDTIKRYKIRYIRRPKPIIIGDIGNLTIEGYTTKVFSEPEPVMPVYDTSTETEEEYNQRLADYQIELSNWENRKEEYNKTYVNVNTDNPCELDPILHREILQRAVELAKAAYTGNLADQITLGHTSSTNFGGYPPSNNS